MATKSNRRRLAKRLVVATLSTAVTAGFFVAPATMAPTASASGTNNQSQHSLVSGDRGTDVKALQFLLKARNFSPGEVDGSFGPATKKAVTKFQKAKGLKVDGIVGNNTWNYLHVTTSAKKGYKNDVRALQLLLGQKTSATLVKDGKFGSKTAKAWRNFERVEGLNQDGIATDREWSKLLGHFERTNSSLCHYFSNTSKQWGTSQAVGLFEHVSGNWNESRHGKASLGHTSWTHGGKLSPHSSHRVGLDVDVAAFMKNKGQCTTTVTWWQSQYDRSATRSYIKKLKATGRVKTVLFNDPVLIREGLTVRANGHDDHFHVRVREHGVTQGKYSYR